MKTTPVKGTNDYLPEEAALREYIQSTILDTYRTYGFRRIMTPAVEDIENLNKSDGGDNLNLIFKILKRGEKLTSAIGSENIDDMVDMGLRYDLTLPLTRFFANNKAKLLLPIKVIQIDKVYRAERPQKGRLREFVQCDIDIIGSDSADCEMELINVTAIALLRLGFSDFKVKINDRRILRGVLLAFGFPEEALSTVSVTFDKLDKIGAQGVHDELTEKGLPAQSIDKLIALMAKLPVSLESVRDMLPDTAAADSLKTIIDSAREMAGGKYKIEFDISLVRGQGYYTGTIFEIESSEFKSSIAGGGRYDNLVGKFIGENFPAVGFSIGFERIYSILSEKAGGIEYGKKRVAVIYDGDFAAANRKADEFRSDYNVALYQMPKKLGKLINALQNDGCYGIFICGKSQELEILKK